MSCKPDTKTTTEMYVLYQNGFSCTEIGKAFGVSRQTVFKRFQRQHLALRKPKTLPFITFQGEKYTRRANGYYAKTFGNRYFLHRAVWESVHGKIPKGYDLHHIDHDRANNAIENLELYTKSEHARKFATGNNQYSKGKKQ